MADNALYWGGSTSADDRMWALLAHLSTFLVIPIIWPLIIWALGKGKPFIRYHAIQAVGVQVALWVAGAVIVPAISFVTCGMGAILYLPLAVLAFVPLYGAWKAFSGVWSGYPMLSDFGKE